jgi:hypothetical protein|tara:strand:- start:244 stop:378 length:135 start_codon:yes stop_codon:yes gene_type:complete
LFFKCDGEQTATVYRILAVIHRKPIPMQLETIIILPELKIEVKK